jgi:hypothetical protein
MIIKCSLMFKQLSYTSFYVHSSCYLGTEKDAHSNWVLKNNSKKAKTLEPIFYTGAYTSIEV